MRRGFARVAGVMACAVLPAVAGACGGEDGAADREPPPVPPSASAPPAAPSSSDSGAAVPPEPGTPAAAAAVIAAYYDAIAGREYSRAYALWGGEGEASGQTFADFEAGFADTAEVVAEVGSPGRMDPAAGSRYVEVPVAVRARTTGGDAQCFRGSYVLRRAVVPGATEAQRRWHIASADIERRDDSACAGVGAARTPADSVVAIVKRFGQALADVSLLAPEDALRR
ncbi:MAG: hypothetical protein ACRELX_08475, partial [Longimicrobiales bacterium]